MAPLLRCAHEVGDGLVSIFVKDNVPQPCGRKPCFNKDDKHDLVALLEMCLSDLISFFSLFFSFVWQFICENLSICFSLLFLGSQISYQSFPGAAVVSNLFFYDGTYFSQLLVTEIYCCKSIDFKVKFSVFRNSYTHSYVDQLLVNSLILS